MSNRPIESLEMRRLLTLVIDYPMEEGFGLETADAADSSDGEYSQDAELEGGAQWTTTSGQTLFGDYGIKLDGNESFLLIFGYIGPFVGGTATVSAWIKTTDVGNPDPASSPGLLGGTTNGQSIFWGWIDHCGRINFSVPGDTPTGGRDTVTSDFPINDGTWYHVTMTRDTITGEIRLYVNGLLQDSALADPTSRDQVVLRDIGVFRNRDVPSTRRYLNASIDQLRVYDDVLSDAEVGMNFDPRGAPLTVPLNLRVVLNGARSITLRWDHVVGASGYEIWRSLHGEDDFELVALAPAKGEFTDTGLERDTSYSYRIRTVSPYGTSAFSAIIATTTSSPSQVWLTIEGTPGDDQIRVERHGGEWYVWNSANRCCDKPYYVVEVVDYVQIRAGDGSDRIEVNLGVDGQTSQSITIVAGPGGDDLRLMGAGTFVLEDNTDADDLTIGDRARIVFDGEQQFNSWVFQGPAYVRLYDTSVAVRHLTPHPDAWISIDSGTLQVLDSPERNAILHRLDELAGASRSASPPWSGPGLTAFAFDSPLETVAVGVVTKVTYAGDVNADERVDADDYFAIDSGFLAQPQDPLYSQGDFNYDGRIDADDYFLIDSSFLGQHGATDLSAPVSASARSGKVRPKTRAHATFSAEPVRSTNRKRPPSRAVRMLVLE